MSISERGLDSDELTQATIEETYAALGAGDTPRLFGLPFKVDYEHDVPNGGGTSLDRKTVYIDRVLYEQAMDNEFKESGLTGAQILGRWVDHERAEVCIIEGDNPVDTYLPAHERALTIEHQGVLAVLGRENGQAKIRGYEEAIWPALLACYQRPIVLPPKDLWCGPNLDDPTPRDKEILQQLSKLGVIDAGKESKFKARYGMGAHRCGVCLHWSPGELSQEHGQMAACRKVSGVVRQDRGCELFEPAMKRGRPVPGGPPIQAPDGEYYVHKPHAKGAYHRVVTRRK